MAHPPSAEMVTVEWLRGVFAVPDDGMQLGPDVATTLPADPAVWSTAGFIQVLTVGGTPAVHTPLRAPVVQVSCWANSPNSAKSPWGKASVLAEDVVAACYADGQQRLLVMREGYSNARLLTAWPLIEPRRIPDDEAGYARVDVDVAVRWVTL